MTACPICAKHRGEGPLGGRRVWHDDLLVVWHAAAPVLGHLFVETRRHAPFLPDLTDEEGTAVGAVTVRLARALRAEPWVALVHTAVAGLTVPHFHQHVFARTVDTPADVPWHASDDWPGAGRGGDDDVAALCARLRTALAREPG